ncbi:MAG: hypothetical protein SOV63_05925 [Pyramidobacter porci]|nr:hypothetical protein [Pyramidobacter porci]
MEIMPQYKLVVIFLQPPFSKNGTPPPRKPTGPGARKFCRAARTKDFAYFYILPEICKLSASRRHFLKEPGRGTGSAAGCGEKQGEGAKKAWRSLDRQAFCV